MGVLGHNSRWRRGWMAGIVGVLILVVVAGCDAGTTRPVAVVTATATLTPTATPSYFYVNSLLTPTGGWDTDQNCFFASDGFHVKPNVACQTPVRSLVGDDVSVWMRGGR